MATAESEWVSLSDWWGDCGGVPKTRARRNGNGSETRATDHPGDSHSTDCPSSCVDSADRSVASVLPGIPNLGGVRDLRLAPNLSGESEFAWESSDSSNAADAIAGDESSVAIQYEDGL
jgi:hypothetical protein